MKYLNRRQLTISILPMIVITLYLLNAQVEFNYILYFVMGYIWNWGLNSPGIYKTVKENKRYRFSFLRLYTAYGNLLSETVQLNRYLTALVRSIAVLIPFSVFLALFGVNNDILMLSVGALSFESIRLLFKK